jgi:sRNA-binding protein
MTTSSKAEKKRGYQEGAQKFELLRAKWPKAFPAKPHEVRPLAGGATKALVEAFGWSLPYARAVLMVWKLRPAYCQAVLRYTHRINLDGSASDEEIDDVARAMAKERLEKIAARRAKGAGKSRVATVAGGDDPRQKATEPEPAAIVPTKDEVKPKAQLAPAIPQEKPEETSAVIEPRKSRKLLVAGSAAMEAALKRRLANGPTTTEVLKIVPAPSSSRIRGQRAR